jgi:hypothetical protein
LSAFVFGAVFCSPSGLTAGAYADSQDCFFHDDYFRR